MKKVLLGLSVVAIVATCYFLFTYSPVQDATMLLINGMVYTANDAAPNAEAVAIRGDRIIGVGSTEEISQAFVSSSIIDLKGKALYPGFIDSHGHLENLGTVMMTLNLMGTSSIADIRSLVAERVRLSKPGEWVRGRGWDQNKWETKNFPMARDLDDVSGDVPVYLERVDGHAVWVNSKVLQIVGITKETKDPDGGKLLRDAAGNPTGVFVDNAIDLLKGALPSLTQEQRKEAIEKAVHECSKLGLTGIHDMGMDLDGISLCKSLIDSGHFPLRAYVAINGIGETWSHYLKSGPEIGFGNGRLTVRAIKLYADGALGSRGAALIEPYTDDPTNRGLTLTSEKNVDRVVREALEKGFQVCTHAIGDRANHIVLNVYEHAFNSLQNKEQDHRFRVEHAQVIAQDDIPRFAKLGVLPAMQPTHCTSDMYWAGDRLGAERIQGAYAWRSLMKHGSIIPAGSDFPFENPNPLWGFYAAITRQDHSGWPAEGWNPQERMTREEALKSFTIWSAYAAFEENVKGSIEAGKYADLVVLSDDIMKIEPPKILTTNVVLTILAGEVVYSSDKPIQ
ncbi:MAG: amidohydrolase [Bacteroidota bacterium]